MIDKTPPARLFDVLSVGELNPDIILAHIHASAPVLGTEQKVGSFEKTLGSSTAICTVRLSRLGLKTAMVAKVGNDENGSFCIEALKREGVNTNYILTDSKVKTGVTVSLTYASDRLLTTYPGSMELLRSEDVPDELLASARHLHVASFYLQTALQPDLASLFKKAKAFGLSTSLDTGWDPQETWQGNALKNTLAYTDIFLPNEKELCALTAEDTGKGAAWVLEQGVEILVVKRGAKGATLYLKGNSPLTSLAFPSKVVDTTGAGDSFNAGFLYGFLSGYSQLETLRWANACGALAARSIGGIGGFKNRAEVTSFLAKAVANQ